MATGPMAWVHEQIQKKHLLPAQSLTLIMIADNVDDHGICWQILANVAKKANIEKRYSRRIIRSLEAKGLVYTISWIRDDGSVAANTYVLRLDDRSLAQIQKLVIARRQQLSGGRPKQSSVPLLDEAVREKKEVPPVTRKKRQSKPADPSREYFLQVDTLIHQLPAVSVRRALYEVTDDLFKRHIPIETVEAACWVAIARCLGKGKRPASIVSFRYFLPVIDELAADFKGQPAKKTYTDYVRKKVTGLLAADQKK